VNVKIVTGQRQVQVLSDRLALPPSVRVRAWQEEDFSAVQRLSETEGWPTPLERPAAALQAWRRSWPALVVVTDEGVIGFIRAVSDGTITTYIAELLVAPHWRPHGIASALVELSQALCPSSRLDLLATEGSRRFYTRAGFRAFAGFRLSWQEREAKQQR